MIANFDGAQFSPEWKEAVTGGAGDDKIDTGAGFDTVILAGNYAHYTITEDNARTDNCGSVAVWCRSFDSLLRNKGAELWDSNAVTNSARMLRFALKSRLT